MDAKRILNYLKQLMANNNREWYQANKKEYDAIRADFEEGVKLAIGRIAGFDPSIAHLSVKDCTYRFNRDTRFSNDKSPYKNHDSRMTSRPIRTIWGLTSQLTARRRCTGAITCTWSLAIVWWLVATTGCPPIS